MNRVFEALCAHLKTHPEAEVQDAVKFLYQASFGGGHFLSDPDGAYLYLLKEAETADRDAPYTEALGEQYARINLSALQGSPPRGTISKTPLSRLCRTNRHFQARPKAIKTPFSPWACLRKTL